ncbi:hypothetical protein ACU4HD_46985 [Cupriavidus basilensis]
MFPSVLNAGFVVGVADTAEGAAHRRRASAGYYNIGASRFGGASRPQAQIACASPSCS